MKVPDNPHELGLPYDSWWAEQQSALQRIVDSKAKTLLVVAPTGSGKTGIAIGLSRMLQSKKSFFLTKTIALQQQYRSIDRNLFACVGKKNFNCILPQHEHKTVDKALCQSGWICPLKPRCPYFRQMAQAARAPEVVFNYAMWLSSSQHAKMFQTCEVMVADEGHELEKEVVKFSKIHLNKRAFERWGIELPDRQTIAAYAQWATELLAPIANSRRRVDDEMFRTRPDSEEMEELSRSIRELDAIQKTLGRLEHAPESGHWFIQKRKDGSIDMIPVWASRHASVIFDAASRKALVMSATLLPTDKTAHRMGITEDFEFIEVPSTFDGSRSPVVYRPVARLNKRNLESNLPKLLKAVDDILDDHLPEERGLIHTASFFLTKWLMENSRHRQQMQTHDTANRGRVIEAFRRLEGKPVLVSPSLGTGFSGDFDIARFQIMVKYPFPDLGDGLTRMRQLEDPESYDYDANSAFVQTVGRIMRAPDDRGISYILDGQLERMAARWPNHFPQWVKERIV